MTLKAKDIGIWALCDTAHIDVARLVDAARLDNVTAFMYMHINLYVLPAKHTHLAHTLT